MKLKLKNFLAALLGPLFFANGCGALLPVFATEPVVTHEVKTKAPGASANTFGAGADSSRCAVAAGQERTRRMLVAAVQAQQMNLQVIANNLANVNTTGFKTIQIHLQDTTGDQANQASVNPGARPAATTRLFTQGELQMTGNNFDLAIRGHGFFEIQMPDGSLAFTRDGRFQVNKHGDIVTAEGCPVQGGFQPVSAVITGMAITASGEVTYQTPSGSSRCQAQLARFSNPSGLEAAGHNLFKPTQASGTPELGTPGENSFGEILQGAVELSNVSVIQEMANLLVAQRAYEVDFKAAQLAMLMVQKNENLQP